MSAKRITARFESRCTKCTQVVPAGAVCLWTPGAKGVTHVTCPESLDVEIELRGAELTARLRELEAHRALLSAVLEDRLLELCGPEPLEPCSSCKGAGVVTERFNVSDTLDYSDFQSYPHACGTSLELEWAGRDIAAVLVDGERATFIPHPGSTSRWDGAYAAAGKATRSIECVAGLRRHNEWRWARGDAEHAFRLKHPELDGINKLIELTTNDLQVKPGDVEATVINRGKPHTGRVTFIGDSVYSSEVRVSIVDADGKKWGGPIKTAVMVRRVARFSAVKP